MSKATLPFWNGGEPFEPQTYPDDLAKYEDAEVAALAGQDPKKRAREVLKVQRDFIDLVLGREGKPKVPPTHVVRRGATETLEAFAARLEAEGVHAAERAALTEDVREVKAPGLKLTVAEIRGGFLELWTKCQDWRDAGATRPLGNGGGTSAPSSLQA